MHASDVLNSHWGHLATKPLQSVALWLMGSALFGFAPPLAVGLALGLPAIYSAVRKQVLWPGCLRHLPAWKDELADTVAASLGVLPFVAPWPCTVVMAGALVCLHRWALP